MKRVHCRKDKYTVYIGRPSRYYKEWGFGNPFVIGPDGDRKTVIGKYKNWLTTGENYGNLAAKEFRRQWILENILKLKEDDILGCFCSEFEDCHGDVIISLYGL